jgi:hypothetical protein
VSGGTSQWLISSRLLSRIAKLWTEYWGSIAMSADITVLYRQFIEAWNAHDDNRMAATFADDGEMIGFDGSQVLGAAPTLRRSSVRSSPTMRPLLFLWRR